MEENPKKNVINNISPHYIYALVLLILGLAFVGGWVYIKSQELPVKKLDVESPKPPDPYMLELTVDSVLGWRSTYAGLLDKSKDAVIERFGQPQSESDASTLSYSPSEHTGLRKVIFVIVFGKVEHIKIFAKDSDMLDVREVIKKARLFNFSAGTFRDSTIEYFTATSVDERTALQWKVSDKDVKFHAVMFTNTRFEPAPAPPPPRPRKKKG